MSDDPVLGYAHGKLNSNDLAKVADRFDVSTLREAVPIWKYWFYLDTLLQKDDESGKCMLDHLVDGGVTIADPDFKSYETFVSSFPPSALAVLVSQRPLLEADYESLRAEVEVELEERRSRRAAGRAAWRSGQEKQK